LNKILERWTAGFPVDVPPHDHADLRLQVGTAFLDPPEDVEAVLLVAYHGTRNRLNEIF